MTLILQGLLAATIAALRAAQKRAQTERPRLQSRARRDKLQAALSDAQTAAAAAQQLMHGKCASLPAAPYNKKQARLDQPVLDTAIEVFLCCFFKWEAAPVPQPSFIVGQSSECGSNSLILIWRAFSYGQHAIGHPVSAGSVRRVFFVALGMSIDALEATEQVAAPDLERLHDTLYALESLTYFQTNFAEVIILLCSLLQLQKGPCCLLSGG